MIDYGVQFIFGDSKVKTKKYQIKLSGLAEKQGQISAASLHQFLGTLIKTAECSTRLLAYGYGHGKGRNPKWLNDSIDFTVTGLRQGSTVIDIEAPTFRDTAHKIFSQQDFWKLHPDLESTALDIVSLAIEEACQEDSPGDRFDKSVLDSISKFKRIINSSEKQLTIFQKDKKRERLTLDKEKLDRAVQRSTEIVESRAYVISGILDRIEHRDEKFLLRVGGDKTLMGQIDSENVNVELLGSMWGTPTTIEGIVHFKANGEPRFIRARRIGEKSNEHHLYERLPTGVEDDTVRLSKAANFKLSKLWGKWPGDETYDELMESFASSKISGENSRGNSCSTPI